jgi:hypothetical protein
VKYQRLGFLGWSIYLVVVCKLGVLAKVIVALHTRCFHVRIKKGMLSPRGEWRYYSTLITMTQREFFLNVIMKAAVTLQRVAVTCEINPTQEVIDD